MVASVHFMVWLKKALGQRLRQLRDEQQLGVEQVAVWCGFDRTHLYNIERGTTWPSVELLASLAQVYRVDLADVFTFPDEHRRHRFRELARLVSNAKLPDAIAAVEGVLGASLDELTAQPKAPASEARAKPKPRRHPGKKTR